MIMAADETNAPLISPDRQMCKRKNTDDLSKPFLKKAKYHWQVKGWKEEGSQPSVYATTETEEDILSKFGSKHVTIFSSQRLKRGNVCETAHDCSDSTAETVLTSFNTSDIDSTLLCKCIRDGEPSATHSSCDKVIPQKSSSSINISETGDYPGSIEKNVKAQCDDTTPLKSDDIGHERKFFLCEGTSESEHWKANNLELISCKVGKQTCTTLTGRENTSAASSDYPNADDLDLDTQTPSRSQPNFVFDRDVHRGKLHSSLASPDSTFDAGGRGMSWSRSAVDLHTRTRSTSVHIDLETQTAGMPRSLATSHTPGSPSSPPRPHVNFLQCWQNQHTAKSIVDNAINKTLEEMGLSPDPSINNFVIEKNRIEDEGISEAIQNQGLLFQRQLSYQQRLSPIISQLTQASELVFAQSITPPSLERSSDSSYLPGAGLQSSLMSVALDDPTIQQNIPSVSNNDLLDHAVQMAICSRGLSVRPDTS